MRAGRRRGRAPSPGGRHRYGAPVSDPARRPHELEAIELLSSLVGPPVGDEVWIGDDCAVLGPASARVLFATDLAAENVHFDRRHGTLADAGWRVLVQNLSDIAAMGGRPRAAVVAVAGADLDELAAIYEGLLEASRRFDCPVVGGDLSDAAVLSIAVAILGETAGSAPVLRRGAGPGETIYVTGPLGGAAAGLRELRADPSTVSPCVTTFLRPQPRLAEGAAAAAAGATAMIDISDGLGIDLWRLAAASKVGVELDDLPVAPGATPDEALGGGEDYELVFTVADPGRLEQVFTARGLRAPVRLGRTTADRAAFHLRGEDLQVAGFEHRLG